MTRPTRQTFPFLFAAAVLSCLLPSAVEASIISWSAPGPVADATSILNNGTAVVGANLNGPAQTVNGVSFAAAGGLQTGNWWTNNGGASTGDAGLDSILNTHQNASGATPFTLTLGGLTVGDMYQLQILVGHDARDCCSGRIYSIGDGAGGDSGFDLARNAGGNGATGSLLGTMVGTFTADAGTQTLNVGGVAGDGVDAALSGYALRSIAAVPEPATGTLAIAALGLVCLRRRR